MITEKRNDLIQFIRQQIIGPGATSYRFVDIEDTDLLNTDLTEEEPIKYSNELINSVPGAFYSSGILFPEDRSESPQSVVENTENEEDAESSDFREETDIEEEEALSINQMYPNTMGLTCCVTPQIRMDSDLEITISCRHYRRLERNSIGSRYGLLLEQDPEVFRQFLSSCDETRPLRKNLIVQEIGKNTVITFNPLKNEGIQEIRRELSEIDQHLSSELGSDKQNQRLSGYKEFLFKQLKNSKTDTTEQAQIYQTTQLIESSENSIAHIKDLLTIHDSRGYGLWKSQQLKTTLSLPGSIPDKLTGKRIYSHLKYEGLRDLFSFHLDNGIKASLSANIQISQNTRQNDNNIFLKVQLQNTSTPYRQDEDRNRYFSVFNELVNERTFFGVQIEISSKHLSPYRKQDFEGANPPFSEDQVNQFVYSQFKDYAIGHGCSVKWDVQQEYKRVSTEYIPEFDTPDVDPIPRDKLNLNSSSGANEIFEDTKCLQFKWLSSLSTASDSEVITHLKDFVNAYSKWIDQKRKTELSLSERKIAEQELNKCQKDADRMLSNIKSLLEGSQSYLEIFRLMNTAMFMQLWHSVNVRNEKAPEIIDQEDFSSFDQDFYQGVSDNLFDESPAAWRPFQLAFILLNLDGILQSDKDEDWHHRNSLVDLVWFPTGGGKTEAYLGLIALTIIYRRQRYGDNGGGTAVLMRYTLRLLTLQQFQRATLLIMALELMRRWDSFQLGTEPIYIGLWVGKGTLPNRTEDLVEEQQKLRDNNTHNRIPFRECPWCGNKLVPHTSIETDVADVFNFNRLHLTCSKIKCSFSLPRKRLRKPYHGPIPVSLSDEEIYQHPPALLFGTVDKFAQLAHRISNDANSRKNDSRRIFGRGNWEEGKPDGYLTPDLIIQDEMHLLLGPLGSAVALFESAIERLCTRTEGKIKLRPKVISSTATTRNTELQIMALFDREVNLFPKSGIECDDSFFSFYKRKFVDNDIHKPIYLSKRKYVGFLPTGRTQIWMQMRLTAILLTHRAIFEKKKIKQLSVLNTDSYSIELTKAMDYYHSIVSYFNSLREVGKTESQIQTYILKEIRRVFHRVLRPGQLMDAIYTYAIRGGELTGRLSGEEVKSELDNISTPWSVRKRFAHTDKDNDLKIGTTPPDFIVATNMISVGIDVSRFNSIIMNSMPRNIAEYIQASSRVARDKEGLVLTIHHPFRARDVSHYEKFIEFHEKMYSYVEPISITPFTKKALDRYLGLYAATIIRHTIPRFCSRTSALEITSLNDEEIKHLIGHLTGYFLQREQKLSSLDVDQTLKNLLRSENLSDIDQWVSEIIAEWQALGQRTDAENRVLVFNSKSTRTGNQEQLYIEVDEYQDNFDSDKWQIPQSLRVIEPEAVIKIYPK